MTLELDEEGAEHGFGIDELLLPGAAAPAAVAPEPLGEEEGWTGIGKFGAEDIGQDTLLQGIAPGRKHRSGEPQIIHANPVQDPVNGRHAN